MSATRDPRPLTLLLVGSLACAPVPSDSKPPQSPSTSEPSPAERPKHLRWRDRLYADREAFDKVFPSGAGAVEVQVDGETPLPEDAVERSRQPGYTLLTRDGPASKPLVVLQPASDEGRGIEAWLLGVLHAQLVDEPILVDALRTDLDSQLVEPTHRERLARCAAQVALDTMIRDFGGEGSLFAEVEAPSSRDEPHATGHACAIALIEVLPEVDDHGERLRGPALRLALFQLMVRFERDMTMEELRRLQSADD